MAVNCINSFVIKNLSKTFYKNVGYLMCNFVYLEKMILMKRQVLIDNTINKISLLPDIKIKEVNDFADFLLSKIDDKIIQEGIQKIVSESKSFNYLKDEDDLYTIQDLKERYK